MSRTPRLRVPCTYQGGKQRIASQIVDILLNEHHINNETSFYDLCCGSGAISIELANRGISPERITMLDASSWGVFWIGIGRGTFNDDVFRAYLQGLPTDKKKYKEYLTALSLRPIDGHEAELFPILQANSFGGKQISNKKGQWSNACFRDYWEPTETSIRRSPANPMQPSSGELLRRVDALIPGMKGVNCINKDVESVFDLPINQNSVVYVDPPYRNTTGYSYCFDINHFIQRYLENFEAPLYVSEGVPMGPNPTKLYLHGANGGITGARKNKHEEWLSRF